MCFQQPGTFSKQRNKLLKTLGNLRKSFPSTFKKAMGQTFLMYYGKGDLVLGVKLQLHSTIAKVQLRD